MPILRPDGTPINGQPLNQAPTIMGFVVLRQDIGVWVPLANDKGNMAIFPSQQMAFDVAKGIADQELRPNPDQKIVTPQQKSHLYVVCGVMPVAQIQANLRDPSQLLADNPAKVN